MRVPVLIVVGSLLIFAVVGWISAYMEAKTYNELTGAHVTTWQAVWVDLRVMESPK